MSVFLSIMWYVLLVFIVCAVLGLFRACRDVKRHKEEDTELRKTRKEVIQEKQAACSDINSSADALRAFSGLSDEQKAEFRKQLLARFQERS